MCKICNKSTDTRFGVCFDCAEIEEIMRNKVDMYDRPFLKKEGLENNSIELSILKEIFDRYLTGQRQH